MQRPVVVGHCHSRAEVIRGNDALHRQDLRVPVNKVASPFDGDLKQGRFDRSVCMAVWTTTEPAQAVHDPPEIRVGHSASECPRSPLNHRIHWHTGTNNIPTCARRAPERSPGVSFARKSSSRRWQLQSPLPMSDLHQPRDRLSLLRGQFILRALEGLFGNMVKVHEQPDAKGQAAPRPVKLDVVVRARRMAVCMSSRTHRPVCTVRAVVSVVPASDRLARTRSAAVHFRDVVDAAAEPCMQDDL